MNMICAPLGFQPTSRSITAFQPQLKTGSQLTKETFASSDFTGRLVRHTVTTPALFKTLLRLERKYIHFNMNAVVVGQTTIWGVSQQTQSMD